MTRDHDASGTLTAVATARATLPLFWKAFDKTEKGEENFALRVRIRDKKGIEHAWATEIERRGRKIYGTLSTEPSMAASGKPEERIEIREADITDWVYTLDGKMVGNQTLRALIKKMPAAEARRYQKLLAGR